MWISTSAVSWRRWRARVTIFQAVLQESVGSTAVVGGEGDAGGGSQAGRDGNEVVEVEGLVERGEAVEAVGADGAYGEAEVDLRVGAEARGHSVFDSNSLLDMLTVSGQWSLSVAQSRKVPVSDTFIVVSQGAGTKDVVEVVGLGGVAVEVEGRGLFGAVLLAVEGVVGADQAVALEGVDHRGVGVLAAFLVEDGVAVEVSGHDDGAGLEPLRVVAQRPVDLADVALAPRSPDGAGPDCDECEVDQAMHCIRDDPAGGGGAWVGEDRGDSTPCRRRLPCPCSGCRRPIYLRSRLRRSFGPTCSNTPGRLRCRERRRRCVQPSVRRPAGSSR